MLLLEITISKDIWFYLMLFGLLLASAAAMFLGALVCALIVKIKNKRKEGKGKKDIEKEIRETIQNGK